jgi:hypothetical protein
MRIFNGNQFLSKVDFLMVCVVIEIKTQGSAKELYWIKEYQVSHASDIQSFSPYMEGGVVKVNP